LTIAPVRDDRRGALGERVREEGPGHQTDEQEDRELLGAARGLRAGAEDHPEQDPVHPELEQRDGEVPAEAEERSLVPGPQLTPGEILEQLAMGAQRAKIGDHSPRDH